MEGSATAGNDGVDGKGPRRVAAAVEEGEDDCVGSGLPGPIPGAWRERSSRRCFLSASICSWWTEATATSWAEAAVGVELERSKGTRRGRASGGNGQGSRWRTRRRRLGHGGTVSTGGGGGMAPVRPVAPGRGRKRKKLRKPPLVPFSLITKGPAATLAI